MNNKKQSIVEVKGLRLVIWEDAHDGNPGWHPKNRKLEINRQLVTSVGFIQPSRRDYITVAGCDSNEGHVGRLINVPRALVVRTHKLYRAEHMANISIDKALDVGDGTWMSIDTWKKILPKAGKQLKGKRTFQGEPVWLDNKLPPGIWEIRKRLRNKKFEVLKRFKPSD